MPAAPGETLLTTLFADVHYFFSPPKSKPRHHAFDRGSYVYLFHNPDSHKTKLEIANNAGTPEQTAFSGYLDVACLSYTFKQPCVCTITVDTSNLQGHEQWHLPAYNERNEQKYLYPIHSLDIYLWTEKDAASLLGQLKAVLPAERQEIRDAPYQPSPSCSNLATPAEHRDSMSPVVQQLEKTAVGAHFPPRAESTVSARSLSQSLPGPPTGSPAPAPAPAAAPMAYNPAAPPAPEPIAHREKTPPPPDDGSGTGLMGSGTAKYDAVPQYANAPSMFGPSSGQPPPTPQGSYFSGPPHQQQQQRHPSLTNASFPGPPSGTPRSGSFPPPPPGGPSPSPGPGQYNPSFAPPPLGSGQTSPPPNQQTFNLNRQSTFAGPPSHTPTPTQYANYNPTPKPSFGPTALASPGLPPGTPGFGSQQRQQEQQPPTPSAPPAYSAGPPLGQPLGSPGLPVQNQAQGQQVFGFSNYNYSSQQQPQGYQPGPQAGYAGDVHSQVYRPTEGEAGGHGHSKQRPSVSGGSGSGRQNSETRTKIEGRVREVEGRVGGYLKKLDKLW